MYFTEEITMHFRTLKRLVVIGAATGLIGACVSPQKPLQADFGHAVNQAIAAQTADPVAVYARDLKPASSGARAASAARRYVAGSVVQPSGQTTSQVGGSAAAVASGGGAATPR